LQIKIKGVNGRMKMKRRINCMDIVNKKDNILEVLSNYISAVDEAWSKKIIPASDDKIRKFKEVSHIIENGYDFPEAYALFLKNMGENDGGLLSDSLCGTANIDELISHYIRYGDRLYDDFEMEPNQLLFFLNEMEAEYYITFQSDGAHIITTNFDDTYGVDGFSESFEKMLFQIAFNKYERQYFEHTIYFGTNKIKLEQTKKQLEVDDILAVVDEYAQKKGFTKTWFSDKWHYIGFKENISLYVSLGFAMSGYIIGDDYSEIDKLAKEMCDIIGTEVQ